MRASYYETIERNIRTGWTKFSVNPEESGKYRQHYINHALVCVGRIGIYEKNTPLALDGKMEKDGLFHVTGCDIASRDRDAALRLIDFVQPGLTDRRRDSIADLMDDDPFAFAQQKDSVPLLSVELNRLKIENPSDVSREIIARLKTLRKQEIMTGKLLDYGIGIDAIEAVLEGGTTLEDIERNPYLSLGKHDIDIQTIDRYAEKEHGIGAYAPMRLLAFLHATLKSAMKQGHSCVRLVDLVRGANWRLSKNEERQAEMDVSVALFLIDSSQGLMETREMFDDVYVYLSRAYREETEIIDNIARLKASAGTFAEGFSIEAIESRLNIRYNQGQRKAFDMIRTGGVKILTGPPGSGKTAVIKGLLEAFGDENGFILGATTGMAAKVMSEATGQKATTVHIMLDAGVSDEGLVGKDLNEPIDRRFIIVDECSMMGVQLFAALLRAVRSGSLLLLVGDEDQLLSVDYGNVLHDLMESGTIEVCRLTEIMRQGGSIRDNALAINSHRLKDIVCDSMFDLLEFRTNADAMKELKKRYRGAENSQILCPIRRGELSAYSVGRAFEDKKSPIAFRYGDEVFRIGQKVVLTRNNYEEDYINGDVGYLTEYDKTKDVATIRIDEERTVLLDRKNLKDLQNATCITIHRSQGSEYQDVHIVLPEGARGMETTRLIYTAVTRGKRHVTVYSVDRAFQRAVLDMASSKRLTLLDRRLAE